MAQRKRINVKLRSTGCGFVDEDLTRRMIQITGLVKDGPEVVRDREVTLNLTYKEAEDVVSAINKYLQEYF